jgi:hypothetical protein
MKMPSYLIDRAADYGCLEELIIDPTHAMACTLGWNITVNARMPHTGITLKMKPGVILGQQFAVQADRILETLDESLSTATGSQMHIREQEAAGVCYLCAKHEHASVNCPKLKSRGPQKKEECVGQWYQSDVNMQNLPRLYKIRKEPIHDPEVTMHQQA